MTLRKQQFADDQQNRYSLKFLKIHRKTSALESLFKQSCRTLTWDLTKKEISAQVFSSVFCISLKTPFSLSTSQQPACDIKKNHFSFILPRKKICLWFMLLENIRKKRALSCNWTKILTNPNFTVGWPKSLKLSTMFSF